MRIACATLVLLLFLPGCGQKQKPSGPVLSKTPVSIRGWVIDVEARPGSYRVADAASHQAMTAEALRNTAMYVDNVPFISGGLSESGPFILLDALPGKTVVTFHSPGLQPAHLTVENVPGNADILIPGVIIGNGRIGIADRSKILVRVAENEAVDTKQILVDGEPVPIKRVPMNDLSDRHEYPTMEETRAVAPAKAK